MTYSITIMIREEKNFNQIIMIKKKNPNCKMLKRRGTRRRRRRRKRRRRRRRQADKKRRKNKSFH